MEEKLKFIAMVLSGTESFASTCRQFDISRQAGYELLERYRLEGEGALVPRSRAPHTHPNAIGEVMARRLLELKARYVHFGPEKVRDYLAMKGYRGELPAVSTIGELFRRHGLVRPRGKKRPRCAPSTEPFRQATAPNIVWSADFKGQYRLGNRQWCYPLTISDNASRYLLVCRGLAHPSEVESWAGFRRAFQEYGLPETLRSDNGVPFASVGVGGLTRMAVWMLRLGITLERIRPGRPDQNGRHERMHRTLKQYRRSPCWSLAAEQRALERFRRHYNQERPHRALRGTCPEMNYQASARPYPRRIPEPEYGSGIEVRRVRGNGQIKWRGQLVFVGDALGGQTVGLRQLDEARWQLTFCSMVLGVLNERLGQIHRLG